jgi:hypothetical protein
MRSSVDICSALMADYPAKECCADEGERARVAAYRLLRRVWLGFTYRLQYRRLNVWLIGVRIKRRWLVVADVWVRRAAPFTFALGGFVIDIRNWFP